MVSPLYTGYLHERYTREELRALAVSYLDIKPRVYKTLAAALPGATIGQLADMTRDEALKVPNLGRAAVNAMEYALQQLKLHFKTAPGPIVNEDTRALAFDVYFGA